MFEFKLYHSVYWSYGLFFSLSDQPYHSSCADFCTSLQKPNQSTVNLLSCSGSSASEQHLLYTLFERQMPYFRDSFPLPLLHQI